jgi:hypothetical protein
MTDNRDESAARKLSLGFSATAPDGSVVTDRIEAVSTEGAWSALEQRGYTHITLHDNEHSAIKLDDAASRRRLVFSAAEEQAMRRTAGPVRKVLNSFLNKNNVFIWLPLLAWLGYQSSAQGFPSRATTVPAALLATFLIWFAWATVPGILYNLALEASAWHRWQEAERYMRIIAKWKSWFKIPFPDHEIRFRTATAEAGQGRLEDALAHVAPLEHDTSLAPGFYHARLSAVYFAAGNFAKVALCQHEARKRSPTPSSAIDLATTLARRLGNARAAQALLADVDVEKQPALVKAFVQYCKGVIAVGSGDAAGACDMLADCLALTRSFAGNPLMQGLVLDARAYYGLALAASGRGEEAAAHLKAARPMLVAREDTTLLAQCDAALSAGSAVR